MIFCPNPVKPNASVGKEALALLLLLALVCLIAWPGMTSPLLLDDIDQFNHVKTFDSWKDCFSPDSFGLFRPFKNFVFYYFQDSSLFRQHTFTLAVYLVAILGIYALLRRITNSPIWASVGALMWASCPTQVITAVWLSAFNLSLSMALSCVCIIFHDLSQTKSGRNAGLSTIACLTLFLAQISYESAVAVPVLCVLIDLLRKRHIFSKMTILRYGALGLVTIAYLVLRSQFCAVNSIQGKNWGFNPNLESWQLAVSAPWFLWKHFSMWMMPAGRLEFCSTYIWGKSATVFEISAAWVWLVLLIGTVFLTWKRLPMISIGFLWFLAASFPSSNFIPIWSGPIEDYYLFFPGVGLVLILLGCAQALFDRSKKDLADRYDYRHLIAYSLILIGGVWRTLCIPLFWFQADLWNRPAELYLIREMSRPYQFQLQTMAAKELMLMGKTKEAKVLALKAYESAPWYINTSMVLGRVAFDTKDYQEAEKRLIHAIRNSPENSPVSDYSRYYLASTYFSQEDKLHLVRETLLKLLENPQSTCHLSAIYLHIKCYLAQEKWDDALRAATKAAALHPNDRDLSELLKFVKEKSRTPVH